MTEPNITPRTETHGTIRMTIAYEPGEPRKFEDAVMILAAMLKSKKPHVAEEGTEQN